MTDKREYMAEYYQRNRAVILYKDRMRRNGLDDNPYRLIDKRIKRVLGHAPEWWEREYFLLDEEEI